MRDAFLARGWDAWSCDIKPDENGRGPHIQGDAIEAMRSRKWDALIAHPVCKYLTNSGVRWLWLPDGSRNEPRWEKLKEGAEFFRAFCEADIPFKAVENPVMHGHAKALLPSDLPKPQFVQPWWFGHPETKATGFWLWNLPRLVKTNDVYEAMRKLPAKERHRVHLMPPGPDREAERSRTFTGLAQACADQWGAHMEAVMGADRLAA